MDRGAWETAIKQEVVNEVRRLLVIDKDDRTSRRHGQQEIEEAIPLLRLVNEQNLAHISMVTYM